MDKELLKKHHFWILLGVFVLPALAVAAFLFTSVNAATSASLKKIDEHGKTLDSSVKSAQSKFLEESWDEQRKVLVARRMTVWEEAWKNQEGIYTWPEGLDQTVRKELDKLSFGDDIKSNDYRGFIRNSDAYLKEYEKFTDEKKFVVQFNGGWPAILKHVRNWDTRPIPSSEEIWLAFEDLWVQRELVRIVHDVNQSAAQFKPLDAKDFPETKPLHKKFRNRFWEVELKVTKQADGKGDLLEGSIRNISDRLQVFGRKNELLLNVDFNDGFPPFVFVIEGDYLNAGDPARKVKTLPRHRLPREVTEIAKVEQVFDSLTVPVWRIDRVAMGYASNRTAPLVNKPSSFTKKILDDAAASAPAGGGAASGTGSTGPMGAMGASGEGGPGGFGGASANPADRTPTGLERNRYITVTNQVRRMQVGLVVIVDQAFLPDVLEAFANSKLRCQNTQYHWKRFRSGRGANPPIGGGGSGIGSTPPIGGFGSPAGEGEGSTPVLGPGGLGSGFGGFGNVAQNTEGLSVSMIELSIYGIATLYEKYKPEAPAETGIEAK